MRFPALWVAKEGSFGVIETPMREGSCLAFRNRFFEGLRFFDSAGAGWEVEVALPKRKPNVLDKLLNRKLEVELRLGPPRQPQVAEVAELLCSCVDREPDDLYDQFVTHDELKTLFRGASSTPELIQLAGSLGEHDDGEGAA